MTTDCAALVLAAGRGRRFGQDKALVLVDGLSLIEHHVRGFRSAGIDPIVVVRRVDAELLPPLDVSLAMQPNPDAPMFDSLLRGLQAIPRPNRAVFITPVDVPPIRPTLLRTLLDTPHATDTDVIAPTFDGHRGHPLLLTAAGIARLLDDAIHNRADRLDHWLDAPDRRLIRVPSVPDATLDFDTPEALERWKSSRSGST